MSNLILEIPEILKYGIPGLGALLALLTYFLIAREQVKRDGTFKFLVMIYVFMFFSILLILIGIFSDSFFKKSSTESIQEHEFARAIKGSEKDAFFLGKWKGLGKDITNYGNSNEKVYGYTYEFDIDIFVDSLGRIKLNGTYESLPKTPATPKLKPRKILGNCIRDGEFLRVIYDTHPQENDLSRGFGVIIFQFLPSSEDAKGFFSARSAKSGALVSGVVTLYRP